jgi:hypothetical protein
VGVGGAGVADLLGVGGIGVGVLVGAGQFGRGSELGYSTNIVVVQGFST